MTIDETDIGPGQVGQRTDVFRIPLGDKNPLHAERQVDQHVARRVQPRQVFGGRRALMFADRQVEASQVAFAARQCDHGLGAVAVLKVDQHVLLLQPVNQRRHREAVRGGQAQGRRPLVEQTGQFLLKFRCQTVQHWAETGADALVGPDQFVGQRRQHRSLST